MASATTPSVGHDLANHAARAIDEFFATWGTQDETESIHDFNQVESHALQAVTETGESEA
jgi:hypothetical protein